MDQSSMTDIELPNAHFFADRWHLKESGIEKHFGKRVHGLIGEYVRRMLDARDEKEFDELVAGARNASNQTSG